MISMIGMTSVRGGSDTTVPPTASCPSCASRSPLICCQSTQAAAKISSSHGHRGEPMPPVQVRRRVGEAAGRAGSRPPGR